MLRFVKMGGIDKIRLDSVFAVAMLTSCWIYSGSQEIFCEHFNVVF